MEWVVEYFRLFLAIVGWLTLVYLTALAASIGWYRSRPKQEYNVRLNIDSTTAVKK